MIKKIFLGIPIITILMMIGLISPVKAAQFIDTDYTLEQTELISENMYISGETVDIKGVIDGDLFVGAGDIYISGTVTGDIFAMGNKINISGTVYGNAYIMGQYLDVSGSIGQNLIQMGMFANHSGNVGKDLLVFSYNLNSTGKVTDDLRVFTGSALIDSDVKGELLIYSDTSNINAERIEGEIYENVEMSTNIEKPEIQIDKQGIKNRFFSVNIVSSLIGFVGLYILGIALIYVAPVKTLKIEKKVNESYKEFLFSFLVGLGISTILPIPLILISFTLIGFPLALVVTMVMIFLYIYGKLWVESAIGNKILQKANREDNKRFLSLLIGRSITTIVNFIPIIRGIYSWVLGVTAVGAVVRMKYDAYKKVKPKAKK
jgi:cytoskeletal protein CcmA (bactofilin family)